MDELIEIEYILYNIYFQCKINKGIDDIENNKVKTSDEVKEIINNI